MISVWQSITRNRRLRTENLKVSSATTNSKYSLDPKLVARILAEVREEEIVSMSSDVINIPSPTGEELQMAQYMQSELQKISLDVTWQEVEESRANVVPT